MKTQKTGHYRYAEMLYEENNNSPTQLNSLQDHIEHCKNNYPQYDLPTFELVDQSECLIASHETINGKTGIHLVVYEQGAGAAVVKHLNNIEFNEAPPPNDGDYIEGQLFIICEENHFLWVSHNRSYRVGSIQNIIKLMFDNFLNQTNIPHVLLLAWADPAKFSNLLSNGISSIEMDYFGYKEAFEYVKQNGRVDGAGTISKFSEILSSEGNSSEAMNKVKTKVIIKPGLNWCIPSIKSHLENVANNAINNVSEDGEVTIKTKNGISIKSSELMVRETFEITGTKRLLDISDTFAKLEKMYVSLHYQNLLTTK